MVVIVDNFGNPVPRDQWDMSDYEWAYDVLASGAPDFEGDTHAITHHDPLAETQARIAELEAALQQAYDAMMGWHYTHGNPTVLMDDEERAMGDACRRISDVMEVK